MTAATTWGRRDMAWLEETAERVWREAFYALEARFSAEWSARVADQLEAAYRDAVAELQRRAARKGGAA